MLRSLLRWIDHPMTNSEITIFSGIVLVAIALYAIFEDWRNWK